MSKIDFIWPMLDKPTDTEGRQAAQRRAQQEQVVREAVITEDVDTLIEETRRLADLEHERRKTAETKAAIYLTFVGVMAPILATIAPETLAPSKGWIRLLITLILFVGAGAYLLNCGIWALKAIRVQVSYHPDAAELAALWGAEKRKVALVRDLLRCVLLNRAGINEKVTAIKMSHEYAVRAFALFVLALLVRTGWTPMSQVLSALGRFLSSAG